MRVNVIEVMRKAKEDARRGVYSPPREYGKYYHLAWREARHEVRGDGIDDSNECEGG